MSPGYNGRLANVVQIQGTVTQYRYSNDNEPRSSGWSGPGTEALGAVQPAGRTLRSEPSQLRPIDKSNKHFNLTYFDPPIGLERHILALFDLQHHQEAWDDRHPGALGQLFFTIRGRAYAYFGDRIDRVDGGPVLFNAFDVAAPYHVDGPWRCLGASLSPFGWAALTQAPVNNFRNRFIPAGELLGEDVDHFSDDLVDRCRSGDVSSEQACIEVAEWIRPRLEPIPSMHEDVIEEVLAWLGSSLNPQVEELFDKQPYSRRQIERLVQRYFGFAPRALARKFRAIRAANLLAQPDLTDEGEAEIAMAFTDQPHMIREIRRFCGYTPSRLGGSQDPMFVRMTNMQNLDRFRPYRGLDNGQEPDGPPLQAS